MSNTKTKYTVYQWSLDGQLLGKYKNAKEASIAVGGKTYCGIIRCCQGKQMTAYGFQWTREEK